jgi:ryanodine receptor 2
MTSAPHPIDTSGIQLSPEILELTEVLAEHVHNHWVRLRMSEGWKHGPERMDKEKRHPSLVSYADLPDSEKQFDRTTALETLKAIIALGYRIENSAGW